MRLSSKILSSLILVVILFCFIDKDMHQFFLPQSERSLFWDFKGNISRLFTSGNKPTESSIEKMEIKQLYKPEISAPTSMISTLERNNFTQQIPSNSLRSNFVDWVKGIGNCVPRVRRDMDLNTTMVVSFPGSGNSMIRYFILQATGYWVCEKRNNGRWPTRTKEQESLPCIVKKSHYSGGRTHVDSAGWPVAGYRNITLFGQIGKPLNVSEIIRNNKQIFMDSSDTLSWERVILLVRNPLDTLKAEFLRRHKTATAEIFDTDKWTDFVTRMFRKWLLFYVFWLNSQVEKLVVHFEELRHNIPQQLKRIMRFINMTHSEEILECVLKHPGAPRTHSAVVNNPYKHFNKTFIENTMTFYENIKELLNKASYS